MKFLLSDNASGARLSAKFGFFMSFVNLRDYFECYVTGLWILRRPFVYHFSANGKIKLTTVCI